MAWADNTVTPTARRSRARTAEKIRNAIEAIEDGRMKVKGKDVEGRPYTNERRLGELRQRAEELES